MTVLPFRNPIYVPPPAPEPDPLMPSGFRMPGWLLIVLIATASFWAGVACQIEFWSE